MDDIGYYIMIGLLVAGAGYSLANRDKPKPPLTKSRRNIAVVCVGIVVVCALLFFAVVLISHGHVQQ
jgi:hypothetical protein